MMRKWTLFFLSMILVQALCGCGGVRGGDLPEEALSMEEYERLFLGRDDFDPLQGEWRAAGAMEEGKPYWGMADYRDGVVSNYDREEQLYTRVNRFRTVDGCDYYSLDEYFIYESSSDDFTDYVDRRYSLTHLDGNTLESETMLCEGFYLEEGPFQGGIITAVDSGGGELRVLLQSFEESGKAARCYALTLKRDGSLGEAVDLKDALEESGLLKKPYALLREFAFDRQGYFYILGSDHEVLYVFDKKGEQVGTVDASGEGKSPGASQVTSFGGETGKMELFCKTRAGDCIWTVNITDRGEKVYFVFGQDGIRELYRESTGELPLAYINTFGDLYYVEDGGALVCRSLATGKCQCLYRSASRDLEAGVALLQNNRGEILCVKEDDQERVSVVTYSPQAVTRDVTLTLYSYDFCQSGTPLDQIIKAFEQTHPGIHIQAEYAQGDAQERERAWMKLGMELAEGKGPDLFYLPRREMKQLAVKNGLMELDQVLPKEWKDLIYGAVLDYGRVGDKLYGLTFEGSFRTLLVRDEVWTGDRWRIEDVAELLRKGEETGAPYLGVCNDRYSENGMTSEEMLVLMLEGMGESPFLNLQEGSCCFDCPEFLTLLQLCKEYGGREERREAWQEELLEEQYRAVLEGRLLSFELEGNRSDFLGFSQAMAGLEDSCHAVGFPTDGEWGNYFVGNYTMAVNKNTDEQEATLEFLRFLYSYEVQVKTFRAPVRKDFLQECVVEKVGWSDVSYLHVPGTRSWEEIPRGKDGTTYLEEYLELMEHCVSRSDVVEEVQAIVCEEAQGYFRGQKRAEQVAEVIQSRVSLYLAQ